MKNLRKKIQFQRPTNFENILKIFNKTEKLIKGRVLQRDIMYENRRNFCEQEMNSGVLES